MCVSYSSLLWFFVLKHALPVRLILFRHFYVWQIQVRQLTFLHFSFPHSHLPMRTCLRCCCLPWHVSLTAASGFLVLLTQWWIRWVNNESSVCNLGSVTLIVSGRGLRRANAYIPGRPAEIPMAGAAAKPATAMRSHRLRSLITYNDRYML